MTQKYRVDTDKGSFLVETDEAQLLPDGSETPAAIDFKPPQSAATPSFNDERSAGQVALDQAGNVVSGMLSPITALPGMIGSGIEAIGQTLSGGGTSKGQELVKGAAQAITAPITSTVRGLGALIAPNQVQAPTGEEFAQGAQGAGALLGSELIGAGASRLMKARSLRAPERAAVSMERKMAPSGTEARLGTERLAPQLAENPVLAKVKAARFTQKLKEQFDVAGANVHAAEQSIPRNTVVPQKAIADGLEAIIDDYKDMGATEAASAVAREWDKWAAKDTNIPWEDYLAMKRRLGKQMETMGQFRESGTASERATGQAMKEAYRKVAEAGNVSPDLEAANHQYWLMHSAMEDSGVSFRSGRKISEIGTQPKPGMVKRVGKKALKYGAIGALGVTGGAAASELLK